MDLKDITKALSTEFRPGDPEHFRLGVWHDGDTLENSSIKISRDLDDPTKTFIDILDKKGTGKGDVSDINKLKNKFNELRKHLPPGDYELNADHPTKAKKYIRDFLKQPGFKLSGERGGAKVFDKKLGKEVFKEFDTLIMNVPGVTPKLKKDITKLVRSEYKNLGLSPTDKSGISALRKSPNIQKILQENNVNIEGLNAFIKGGGIENEKKLLSVKPAGQPSKSNRPKAEIRPGQKLQKGSKLQDAVDALTERFTRGAVHIDGHTPEKMQQYFDENAKLLSKLKRDVAMHNTQLKKLGADANQFLSRGHDARLSESIDSPRNIFLELLTENVAKGDKYSVSPGASLATGNPVREGVDPLRNWFADYATWLDKSENGGTGALAQRGDYSDLLEQHIRALGSDKWNDLTPTQQKLRLDAINDLTTNTEKLNQWLPSEGVERRKWGILLPDQAKQATEIVAEGIEPTIEVGESGRRLGGLDGPDLNVPKGTTPNVIKDRKVWGYMNDMAATALKNPYVKAVGSAATGTAKFAGSAAAAFDPINAVTGTYGALTADNPATGLEQGLKGVEGAASTAAWFVPAAAKVALPLAGATAIAEAQRVPEVFKGIEEQPVTNITGDRSRPLGYKNPFESLFKRQDRSLTIDKQDRGL